MSAFSYYVARDYSKSIESAQRFLSIHPGNRDAPYAYYLVAICYYEQISDVTRDQKVTEQARTALTELVRRYPNSRYAADARLKLDLVNDHLAGKEMTIGRMLSAQRQVAGRNRPLPHRDRHLPDHQPYARSAFPSGRKLPVDRHPGRSAESSGGAGGQLSWQRMVQARSLLFYLPSV